uniref:BHLH domain-containing protein n=1 Tax=Parascaris univalens TaxID=6257 RepID=A0A914ZWV7_PARUN
MTTIVRHSAYSNWRNEYSVYRNVVSALVSVSLLSVAPLGYHLVVLNLPEKVIQSALNVSMSRNFRWSMTDAEISIFWSVVVSSQSIGALLACLLIVPLWNRHGTKTCVMMINSVVLLVGSVVMASAAFFEFALFLIAGRIIIGIYTGLASTLVPLFMRELAPSSIKGALSCCMHIAVCLGVMLAAILSLDFVLGTATLWGLLLAMPAIFGILQMILSVFLPDTPNHLLSGGDHKEAASSIRFYYGIIDIRDERVIAKYREVVTKMPEQISYRDAIADTETKWAIFVGMVVSAAQVFCGSMATISYSTSMFMSVSLMSALIEFLPAFGAVLSAILTLPALYLVEAYGRRLLFLSTLSACVISDFCFLLFSLLSQQFAVLGPTVWSVLFSLSFLLYGVGYNLGVGPVAYFIPSELVIPEAASVALGAAVAVNWFSTLITTLVYYPLNVAIGGWSYLLFALPSTIFVLFLWRYLPETKELYRRDFESKSFFKYGKPGEYGTFIIRHY